MVKLKCDTNLRQKGLTQTACCYIYYWRDNKGGHLKRGALRYINYLSPKKLELFGPAKNIVQIRVGILHIEWEWEVLTLSYYEIIAENLCRLSEELVILLVTWLAFCEELIENNRNSVLASEFVKR